MLRLAILANQPSCPCESLFRIGGSLLGNTLVLVAPKAHPVSLKIAPNFPLAARLGAGRLATTALEYYTRLFKLKDVRIVSRRPETRAALAATVIAYRSRSAIRDVGKALGLSPDTVGASVMAAIENTPSGK